MVDVMTRVALSLGGNLGDVAATFDLAVAGLLEAGMADIRRSAFYRNPPVGCASGTPDFINAAISGNWPGSVDELHECCRQLEERAGRPRCHEAYASRPLDVDIILFGGEIINTPTLRIPHREALNRLFVLVPLAEVAGDWPFPGQDGSVAEMLSSFTGSEEYRLFIRGRQPAS